MYVLFSSNIIWGILIVLQTGIGCLGNLLLFIVYTHILFIQPHQKRPLDVILIHLTLANVMTATLRGIPYTRAYFGVRNVLEAIRCEAVLCIRRVTRGVCMCTSSLLSTFKAVISPAHARWAWLKSKIFAQILPLLIYSWVSSVLINTWVILSTAATGSSTDGEPIRSLMCCETRQFSYPRAALFHGVMCTQDFFFLFLMIWTSLCIVTVLFSHHKATLSVHSTSLSPRSFPEMKAASVVVFLVSCLVFYGAHLRLTIYMTFFYEKNLMLQKESITNFLGSCYPMVCALMLIKYDNRVSRYTCAFSNMILFPCSQLEFPLHLKNTDKNDFNCKRTGC